MWLPAAAELRLTVPFGSGVDLQIAAAATRSVGRTDASLLSFADGWLQAPDATPLSFSSELESSFRIPRADAAIALGGRARDLLPQPWDSAVLTGTG